MTDKLKVTTKKKATTRRTTKATAEAAAPVATTTVAVAPKPTPAAPTRDDISARAHDLYVASGHQHGREVEFWLEAERQLKDERKV